MVDFVKVSNEWLVCKKGLFIIDVDAVPLGSSEVEGCIEPGTKITFEWGDEGETYYGEVSDEDWGRDGGYTVHLLNEEGWYKGHEEWEVENNDF